MSTVTEQLNKSLDEMIDQVLGSSVQKSMIKDEKPEAETADEVKVEGHQKDEARGAGRPKQISDVPQTDTDGKREKSYDEGISSKEGEPNKEEDDQVDAPKHVKKSFSDEEYAEYQELKKAKAEEEAEELRKAQLQEQSTLIKSAVEEAISPWKEEVDTLKKALSEQNDLIKSFGNRPQPTKAVTNMRDVEAVEKFQKSYSAPSKADVLDCMENLVKSNQISIDSLIEFEQTGQLYKEEVRRIVEKELKKN